VSEAASAPRRGVLLVLSGPSGCGKTTISRILASDPGSWHSVSATTRKPRVGERNGVDYWFMTTEEFESGVAAGKFAEHKLVFGNRYGTPRAPLDEALAAGKNAIVDVDVQGAQDLMNLYPEGVFVFVLPPSSDVLKSRLAGRKTETAEEMQKRLKTAEWELTFKDSYDRQIVNDDLDETVEELRRMIRRGGKVHGKKV
jgi:guanylate kinase